MIILLFALLGIPQIQTGGQNQKFDCTVEEVVAIIDNKDNVSAIDVFSDTSQILSCVERTQPFIPLATTHAPNVGSGAPDTTYEMNFKFRE